MHIQAPSWRHLLRLMAKLSATRIEPAIQALAETKADLKLRTVVQFIKVRGSFCGVVRGRSSVDVKLMLGSSFVLGMANAHIPHHRLPPVP